MTSRLLAYLVAGMFFLLGIVLYLAPGWASRNFSWSVSPFVVMTMGSWFLGGAFVAWRATVLSAWSVAYPGLLFLGAFGVLQVGVLLFHRNDVGFDQLLGGSYLLIVLLVAGAAFYWASQWFYTRIGRPAPTLHLRLRSA